MRRLQPDWLTENDDLILELLGDTGVALNKRGMEVNLDLRDTPVSYSTIKRRVDELEDNGFLEDVGETGSYYRVSDRGRRYLTGSPYGTSEITEGVEPITVEPLDYTLLTEIYKADTAVDEEDVLFRIDADREAAEDRLSDLLMKGVIERGDSGLALTIVGQVILGSFQPGRDVMPDVRTEPRQVSDESESDSSSE